MCFRHVDDGTNCARRHRGLRERSAIVVSPSGIVNRSATQI